MIVRDASSIVSGAFETAILMSYLPQTRQVPSLFSGGKNTFRARSEVATAAAATH